MKSMWKVRTGCRGLELRDVGCSSNDDITKGWDDLGVQELDYVFSSP